MTRTAEFLKRGRVEHEGKRGVALAIIATGHAAIGQSYASTSTGGASQGIISKPADRQPRPQP